MKNLERTFELPKESELENYEKIPAEQKRFFDAMIEDYSEWNLSFVNGEPTIPEPEYSLEENNCRATYGQTKLAYESGIDFLGE
jgi:hypothetical protein